MKQTTIEIRELTASNGMLLTDGTIYAKNVYLAPSAKVEDWREVPESEAPAQDTGDEIETDENANK